MFESRLITGDCRSVLPQLAADGLRVQTCITSPPYYRLRRLRHAGADRL